MLTKKAAYPIGLFLATALISGYSILCNQLTTVASITYAGWPYWITLILHFLLGLVFAAIFYLNIKSTLSQFVLTILNLTFAILNAGSYFFFCMNPIIPPTQMSLLLSGYLFFLMFVTQKAKAI